MLRSSLPIKCALSEIIEHGTTKPATQVDSLSFNLIFLVDEFPSKSGVHSKVGAPNNWGQIGKKMSGGHINDPFGTTLGSLQGPFNLPRALLTEPQN